MRKQRHRSVGRIHVSTSRRKQTPPPIITPPRFRAIPEELREEVLTETLDSLSSTSHVDLDDPPAKPESAFVDFEDNPTQHRRVS